MKLPTDYNSPQITQALQKVARMANNSNATTLAGEFGLSIQNVSWEDCSRSKQSCWGPCISDMTLQVESTPLPIIRLPNFSDVSWDQPMKNIPLNVGNENDKELQQISLHEYLSNISEYLHTPGSIQPLIAPERDSHVIMTSQACFLPVVEGADTKFNVCLYNYQSRPRDPAVLVIVASSSGTSAQIVDKNTAQTLYFNKNGEKASFIAKRLKDQRRERGEQIEGEMTNEEKADNMILVIQVPLKQQIQEQQIPMSNAYLPEMDYCQYQSAAPMHFASFCSAEQEVCDVDQAMISVGDTEGEFSELNGLIIERDNRYPVRVTLQYYKATSNGEVTESVIEEIAVQMITARSFAEHNEIGSLVTGDSNSKQKERPTETKQQIPGWWPSLWAEHHPEFPDFSENQAKKYVFASSFAITKNEALAILRKQNKPSKPLWDPSSPLC